ncbi:MAG: serine/threonine protein kinase, partial [Myxococcales bacterium]|nr:serine/threonine protein kinase [Myxococcales bacterium]
MRQPIPFGKYVLLERISVGGMAEVFKAKSFGVEGFEKILAIKRILPSMAEDADFIEMFIDEAKICGQLNHANICQIFELGRVEDSHFIAMEYVWGKDVLQIQNRFRKLRQTMKAEMAAFIAAKLCEGLDYAHKKKDAAGRPLGIIHRDISPQNILISYDGELKIIDFGIAKAASRSSKTQAGVLKGKFGYMSPEQVRGLPLDRRSDVFAIGTILYELLTSDRLFMGESDFETLEKVRNVDVPPVTSINKNVPPELERILNKALARDVDERFQWANEMQEALHAFLLTREPVFTAKHLSTWMREQFALEMKREQQILDEQRKIGKDVLGGGKPASGGAGAKNGSAASHDSGEFGGS